jgi:AcrR family transcriptional regulator
MNMVETIIAPWSYMTVVHVNAFRNSAGAAKMTEVEQSRRERKKDETRERITRAAVSLFREKGFAATTVDEIATRADVAKGTFFNYFPRKEAVLAGFAHESLVALQDHAAQLMNEQRPTREKLLELFLAGAHLYVNDPEIWLHTYLEMMKGPVSALVEVDSWAQRNISAVIAQGQSAGDIRTDHSPERLAYMLRSVFFFTTLSWLYCPEMFQFEDEMRTRLEIALDGLAVRRSS